jgi:(2R)-ethylmalonyl-CoA mutase
MTALEEGVDVVGLSILSGSHVPLGARGGGADACAEGLDDVPVVVGGIVPPEDEATLKNAGVAAVYTPKDFQINQIMSDVVRIVEQKNSKATV